MKTAHDPILFLGKRQMLALTWWAWWRRGKTTGWSVSHTIYSVGYSIRILLTRKNRKVKP